MAEECYPKGLEQEGGDNFSNHSVVLIEGVAFVS